MRPFVRETGVGVPLPQANLDTDQIIPKQFLKRIERTGYGDFLFNDWRYDPATGADRPDFVLNQPPYREGTILVAGRNFGAGSSREHAVWALTDFGFRAVIAPSFADIFHENATKGGLLTVALPENTVDTIVGRLADAPGTRITIDLDGLSVSCDGVTAAFDIDPFERRCYLEGLDDIGLTLEYESEIGAYESQRPAWMPDLSRQGAATAP
ncbi:MAG: 3-isopropylmalate dehydratase small subunit [Candidatus Dormibacteria bacterium]